MNKVTLDTVKPLLQPEGEVALSIYLPTHKFPSSEHIQEDRIRFKNLVRASYDAILSTGASEEIIRQMTDQMESEIYNNDEFWQQTTEGLAVFCAPSGLRYLHLPIEIDEYMVAGDLYDVTPLLALCSYDQPHYVLAVAARQPMLYKGDMYDTEPVDINLPSSIEEALNIDELNSDSHSQAHSVDGSASGTHGQGDSKRSVQEDRLKYFRMIDDAVMSSDEVDQSLPVILAGADDEVSAYREASKIRGIMEQSINGNQTASAGVKPDEIHDRSWPIVEEEVGQKHRQDKIESLKATLGTGKASTDIDDIKKSTLEGRVDSILIGFINMTRDLVNDSDDPAPRIVLSEEYTSSGIGPCSQDVFNRGGKVYGILIDDMPEGANQAALYRY